LHYHKLDRTDEAVWLGLGVTLKRTVFATVILLAATSAVAAPPAEDAASAERMAAASPSAAADAAEAPTEEKKICRTERSTGSLTRSRRICMTQTEWDQLRRETKRDVDDMQRNGGAIPRVQGAAGATAGTG
jgi:hypothetical protein